MCATDSGVAATYIVELRTSSGELVHRTAAEYHDSILIEETQTVDTCSSYTLNVTVSVPSFPELGSHTNITNFDVQIKCPTEGMQGGMRGKEEITNSCLILTESPTPSVSVTHSQTMSVTHSQTVSVTHSQTASRNGGSSPGVGGVKAQGKRSASKEHTVKLALQLCDRLAGECVHRCAGGGGCCSPPAGGGWCVRCCCCVCAEEEEDNRSVV